MLLIMIAPLSVLCVLSVLCALSVLSVLCVLCVLSVLCMPRTKYAQINNNRLFYHLEQSGLTSGFSGGSYC